MLSNQQFLDNINKIEDLVFGFGVRLCGNRNDAKDLYQETLTKAFANLDKYKEGTHFKSWVTTIMRNSFINEYRKRKTRKTVTSSFDDDYSVLDHIAGDDSPSRTMFGNELQAVVRALPIQHRKPFMMSFEGYQYQEIADEMNLPVGTVKSRIHFAKKQMQKTIRANFGIRQIA